MSVTVDAKKPGSQARKQYIPEYTASCSRTLAEPDIDRNVEQLLKTGSHYHPFF
jgi:hypothetical protein